MKDHGEIYEIDVRGSVLNTPRIDLFLSKYIENISRSYIQKLIKEGHITVNGNVVKVSYKPLEGDQIKIHVPPKKCLKLVPENIPLNVLYEDEDIIVIAKKRGMVVHPGSGIDHGTLVNALLHHCQDLAGIGGTLRPGVVHRLDKGTSGVLIVAKNNISHERLSRDFAERRVKKEYEALLLGDVKWSEKIVEKPIGRHPKHRKQMAVVDSGRYAKTHFTVLSRGKEIVHVAVKPDTGRTHQIRVHAKYSGSCVVADFFYCPNQLKHIHDNQLKTLIKKIDGFCLHATRLTLKHPTRKKEISFFAPIPGDMREIMEAAGIK